MEHQDTLNWHSEGGIVLLDTFNLNYSMYQGVFLFGFWSGKSGGA